MSEVLYMSVCTLGVGIALGWLINTTPKDDEPCVHTQDCAKSQANYQLDNIGVRVQAGAINTALLQAFANALLFAVKHGKDSDSYSFGTDKTITLDTNKCKCIINKIGD